MLDAVQAIQTAFDLPHQGAARDQHGGAAHDERDVAVSRAGPVGLVHGLREQLTGGTGHGRPEGAHDQIAGCAGPQRARESDQRDDALHRHERGEERERARVAEPVGGAHALEPVPRELEAARAQEGVPRVVPGQGPGLRHFAGDAHRPSPSGTQTSIVPGSTTAVRCRVAFRSPPSSS